MVDQELKAQPQPVKVSWTAGDETVLAPGGLQPGQRVVTDGQLRLTPGAKVEIKSGS
jgi:multidrug efflux system membrane fusion protein